MEDPEQLICHQLRTASAWGQWINPYRAPGVRISGIYHNHITETLRWDVTKHLGDEISLGLNDYDTASGGNVLDNETEQQRRFARPGRSEDMEMTQ